MLTTSNIRHKPTISFRPDSHPKHVSQTRVELLRPRSKFFSEFTCKSLSSKKFNGIEAIKASALKGRSQGDEEDSRLFQEKASIDESTSVFISWLERTINHLSKWLMTGLFVAVILWRHDPEAILALNGKVMNFTLCVTLKKILKQERPVSSLRSDHGMPSSHAQSVFFIYVFVALSVVEWLGINKLSLTLSGVTFAIASHFSWLRVSEQLHTISQVIIGATLGACFSILWSWLWNQTIHQVFDCLLWVRTVVYLGAAVFCLCFLLSAIKDWFVNDTINTE